MNRLPPESTATAEGPYKAALVAGPPSPEKDAKAPVPAITLMMPAETLKIRKYARSAMNRVPAESTAIPLGAIAALVACPPSPEKIATGNRVAGGMPFPATVVTVPDTLRTRLFPLSEMKRLPAESTTTEPGEFRDAVIPGPPSPEKLNPPLPPNVVMIPPDALRIRPFAVSAM